ncbi:uncharacterized protein LOC132935811 [Metopolophium dirhodum]|uniref:uncharacterized protein LOC132935811 n=1 Tax=Metopolophium dirhodum TaxID=44670 RepID=UPI00298F9722|nr:uncharacterized protein LOC132935811 [Metopolophium dirhodum]
MSYTPQRFLEYWCKRKKYKILESAMNYVLPQSIDPMKSTNLDDTNCSVINSQVKLPQSIGPMKSTHSDDTCSFIHSRVELVSTINHSLSISVAPIPFVSTTNLNDLDGIQPLDSITPEDPGSTQKKYTLPRRK